MRYYRGMDLQRGTSAIEVKLSTSGRYTWVIRSVFPSEDGQAGVVGVKKLDTLLKQEFPDYAKRGSGRIAAMDED